MGSRGIGFFVLLSFVFIGTNVYSIQDVESFPIPSTVSFAGQNISLERYDMRERFDREQIVIAYNHSNSLLQLKRANRYFPIIEPILTKNGVPEDFKYLAVIESNLDPRALSGAGAAGIWQMMPKTGQQFGLEVTDEVDERYNVEKETEAVCIYLKSAYNKYKNWTTVAASYNAGMGRISDEQTKQQVEESFDMLLNSESSRYVFRMLAMKVFIENPKKYGYHFGIDDFYHEIQYQEIKINSGVDDWTTWASKYGITYSQLKDFNIWLRDRKLTNADKKEYIIRVPEKKEMNYSDSKIKIYNPNWIDTK